MSRVERQRHKLKLIGREWSAWKEIPITAEIRASSPHMQNVKNIWANSRFEVHAFHVSSEIGGIVQLVIARHQHLSPITWSDVQRIKVELFGESNFAIEIYPPQAVPNEMKVRIVWVMPETFRPPCGLHLPTAWGGE